MSEIIEEWIGIEGYLGLYEVSSFGRIKTLERKGNLRERIIKGSLDSNGYPHIQLWKNGKLKCFKIHRLVANAFIPNPKSHPQVNHKDGNKKNNHYSNLEWVTCKENINHAIENNLRVRGFLVRVPKQKKLSETQIQFIKKNKYKGCNVLAKQFNVSNTTIWRTINK